MFQVRSSGDRIRVKQHNVSRLAYRRIRLDSARLTPCDGMPGHRVREARCSDGPASLREAMAIPQRAAVACVKKLTQKSRSASFLGPEPEVIV